MAKGRHVFQKRGCAWQRGHPWQRRACVGKRGVYGEGGMYGKGGCAWQRGCMVKGVCGKGGACVARGGMHGELGHVWQERRPLQRTVCILLECILVAHHFMSIGFEHQKVLTPLQMGHLYHSIEIIKEIWIRGRGAPGVHFLGSATRVTIHRLVPTNIFDHQLISRNLYKRV